MEYIADSDSKINFSRNMLFAKINEKIYVLENNTIDGLKRNSFYCHHVAV